MMENSKDVLCRRYAELYVKSLCEDLTAEDIVELEVIQEELLKAEE